MFARPLGRVAVATIALTLVATTAPSQALAARAPHYPAKATAAADWQASQLSRGRIHNGEFDFIDWGLTVDTAFALAAAGTEPRKLKRVGTAIENNYWKKYATFGGDVFAGALAKSLLVAKVLGKNARKFGGRNARARLLALVADSGFEAGRVRDTGASDFSSTFAQAYAVLGLARSGGVPQPVVNYLRKQQCADGYFRLNEVVGETCNQSASPADVDATALAIQALVAARASDARVPGTVVPRASRWLVSVQRRNGSFGGGASTPGANANSTGLAAQALQLTRHRKARKEAAAFVASLQVTRAKADDGPAKRDIGAIAYNRAALRDALANGIQLAERDQFRRATPQGMFAFRPKALGTLTSR